MNKLCYIDQRAHLKYYLHSMNSLEAQVPGTVMVYATIPLTTAADSNNYLRNAFNDRLREWVRQNGRVLFDIADIEAHDPSGNPATFEYHGKTCQKLYEKYTSDGGHLEGEGRQNVARGFYALSATLIESGRIRIP
jgi:lysophospholipase L1-like esterase